MFQFARLSIMLILTASMLAGCIIHQPARDVVYAPKPPPAKKDVVVVVRPGKAWIPGHWTWRRGNWVWIRGHHMVRPHRHSHWVSGHWKKRPRGWVWIPGHWSRR
jgi:hypothetical protein